MPMDRRDWRDRWHDDPASFVGARVDVILVDGWERHAGTLDRLECDHYPIIRLDDGREVGGMACWWTPEGEV